jgi:[glutamine synthetase] adenylyltransferase / [glutamine synthetase]-adenylyl-L-tyrosine phosphorylase
MPDLHQTLANVSWPRPADPEAAERERAAWLEAADALNDKEAAGAAKQLIGAAAGQAALDAIFGNSPFLASTAISDPAFTVDLLRGGPDAALMRAVAEIDTSDTAALMRDLRRARRRVALTVGLADIANAWPLEKITGALSDFADLATNLAARQVLREAQASGVLPATSAAQPEVGSGLVIIGMGKLGARELNYSSDIDLIVLYDRERIATDDPAGLQRIFVRLTRGIVRILEERTSDGYVFRTDLRLRPDPGSTPLAMSVAAAEAYYESHGQNWERAAMIKARAIAGDIEAGNRFLGALRPYVWRKHLDFAAIQDIHSIKRQINAHRGGGSVAIAGHNIKLGRGGIREIEFFAQTQQLIWGGRRPELRQAMTCDALRALAAAGRIDKRTADEMIAAYHFLRRVEHRLQMIDDRQTHTLPAERSELERLATFLGYADCTVFEAEMLATLRRVERHYARLFEEAPALSGPGNLVFTGTEDDPGTLATLTRLGYADVSKVAATIRGWHHGRYRAMRSVRARELLTELMPTLLEALAKTPQPDAAFMRFDAFLAHLPSGVQIFSLFQANPGLLDLLAEIMGSAPRLAEALAAHANLLDSVLTSDFLAPLPDLATLNREMADLLALARDFQDVLDLVRRRTGERRFQVAVQLLRGLIDAEAAGAALADIAECALAALQPAVERDFARQHGTVRGGSFAIVALGKLGGRELTYTSDVDLIFLYDAPAGVEASRGERPLPVSLYYARLANRFVAAVTALTGEGRLYDVDSRLRPSGSKGPVASDCAGFIAYQQRDAWTWEHQALTRARPITGPPALRERISAAIRDVLTMRRDADKLAHDIAEMRVLMAREHPGRAPWDIKHRPGGLVDVEFVAQYLQLREAADRPGILATNTLAALGAATRAGAIAPTDGATLGDGLRLWHAIQHVLRLTVEGEFDPAEAPEALKSVLVRATQARDFPALEARLEATAAAVRTIFEQLLPRAAAPAPSLTS